MDRKGSVVYSVFFIQQDLKAVSSLAQYIYHYNPRLDAEVILQLYQFLKRCEPLLFSKIKFWYPWQDSNYSVAPFLSYCCYPSAQWLRLMALRSGKSDIICQSIDSMNTLTFGRVLLDGKVPMRSVLIPPQTY